MLWKNFLNPQKFCQITFILNIQHSGNFPFHSKISEFAKKKNSGITKLVMEGIAWNCREMVQPQSVQQIRALIRVNNLDWIFLSGTRGSEMKASRLIQSIGISHFKIIGARRKSGHIFA